MDRGATGSRSRDDVLLWFTWGQKLEQIHSRRIAQTVNRPAAHAQLAVVQRSGSSTKTAIKGSKKFSSRLSKRPLPSAKKPPSGICESEQPRELSFGSKHSHLGCFVLGQQTKVRRCTPGLSHPFPYIYLPVDFMVVIAATTASTVERAKQVRTGL